MPFNFVCNHCDKPFQLHTRIGKLEKRYCSRECAGKAKQNAPIVPCRGCGIMFKSINSRPYCSWVCYRTVREANSSIFIIKICKGCEKTFEVRESIAHRFKFCTIECKRTNSGNVKKQCLRCGCNLVHRASDIKRGLNRVYCSEDCRRPVHTISCLHCGKEKRVGPSGMGKRFCSLSCYRKFSGKTTIETAVQLALQMIGVPFINEVQIGKYSVDFLVGNKIIIEADGVYWHKFSKEKDERRDKYMVDNGFIVIRIGETEIINSKNLCTLVVGKLDDVGGSYLIGSCKSGSKNPDWMVRSAYKRRKVVRLDSNQTTFVLPTTDGDDRLESEASKNKISNIN